MTPAEKKHFSKYLLLHSAKTTLKGSVFHDLFTAIGKMKIYDEEILRRKFQVRISSERSFITLKSGLKELVLDSLRNFGVAQSEAAGYRRKLDNVEILAKKGLEKEALVALRQLKKEIIKKTRSKGNSYLADVLVIESWLIERADSANVNAMQELLRENLENSREMYLSHHILCNVNALGQLVTSHLAMRNKEEEEQFSAIKLEMELWKETDEDGEPFNRFLYLLDARSNMALLDADFESNWHYADKMWQRFSRPDEVEQFIQRKSLVFFSGAFINAARGCLLAQKADELRAMLHKARPIYEQQLTTDAFHYPYYHYFQLMLAYLQNDHKAISLHMKPILQLDFWNLEHGNVLQQRTFATGIALAYYRINDLKNAEKWARKTGGFHPAKAGETVSVEFCQLFQFMVEFERLQLAKANVNEWLKFSLRAEAQLEVLKKQNGRDFRFSIALLRFIVNASQFREGNKLAALTGVLQSEIEPLKTVQNVKQFYGLFDFDAWVGSHLVPTAT